MEPVNDTTQLLKKEEKEFPLKMETSVQKPLSKRKKTLNTEQEDDGTPLTNVISEVFLRIIYPLTVSMDKSILVGIFKTLDFLPGILLNNSGKALLFSESGWNSFNKNKNLVQCYLLNNVYGKKTSIRLSGCNIEVDIIKFRSSTAVRFRDLTRFDSKVVLNPEEFSLMLALSPAINRYLDQLIFCGPVIKDYLMDTTHDHPNMQLIYGPVDTSVYNRLPQEVDFFRTISTISNKEDMNTTEHCSTIHEELEEGEIVDVADKSG